MLDPPHCLQTLFWRLCSQMLEPPHCLHPLLSRVCSQMLEPPHCLTRFFGGCARRCLSRRIACTCFLCGCARRCLSRRIACTRFFGGCADTLRVFSSQLRRLPCYRPLLLHAAAFGPRCLPRLRTLSLLHSLLLAFALEATLLVLCLFLSLVFKLLDPRPTSLSAQPLSCSLAPSTARVAKPTFLNHFLVSTPDPALKLSQARSILATPVAPSPRSAA